MFHSQQEALMLPAVPRTPSTPTWPCCCCCCWWWCCCCCCYQEFYKWCATALSQIHLRGKRLHAHDLSATSAAGAVSTPPTIALPLRLKPLLSPASAHAIQMDAASDRISRAADHPACSTCSHETRMVCHSEIPMILPEAAAGRSAKEVPLLWLAHY
jgi:hypothetical protein